MVNIQAWEINLQQTGSVQCLLHFWQLPCYNATNESRFAIVDIPATFCIILFFYILSRDSKLGIPTCLKLGLVAGVGIAIKYPTIFVLFSILIFIREVYFFRKLLLILSVSALVFTTICPYWIIDLFSTEWNHFFSDFFYESRHYNRGHFGLFTTGETGIGISILIFRNITKMGYGITFSSTRWMGINLGI